MVFSIARSTATAITTNIASKQTGRLVPFLAVCFAAGALLYLAPGHEPPVWSGAALAGLGGAAFVLLRRRWLGRGGALMALALASGFLSGQAAVWRAPAWDGLPRWAVFVDGTVRGVDVLPDGRRVSIAEPRFENGRPLRRFIRVRLQAKDTVPVMAGDHIAVRALLHPPPESTEPGGPNLRRDAFFSGLAGSGWAIGPASITLGGHAASVLWWRGIREAIAARFLRGLPAPEGAIAATLFAGDQTAIPAEDRLAFGDSGLAHLLAVAGLHIAIVMGFGYGAARIGLALSEYAALRWPCKQIAALAGLGLGLFYMLLTGAHLPILRSFSMAALVVLAVISGRRAASLRGLGLAAILILAIWPQSVLDVSFQMSFAAVLALIEGHRAALPWLMRLRDRRWLDYVGAMALTSLLAGLASMPFAAAHFGHATAYFVPANLLAVPLTAFWVMPAGLITLALMPLHLDWLMLPVLRVGLHLVLLIARIVSAWPGAVFSWPPYPGWALALTGLGLAWIAIWRGGLRLFGVLLLAVGLAAPWVAGPPDMLVSPDLHLIALRRDRDMAVEELPGSSGFTLDSWRRYWGRPSVTTLPPTGQGAAFRCDPESCRLGAALLMRAPVPPACAGVSLVIDEQGDAACPGLPFLDAAILRQRGAAAVWIRRRGALLAFARAKRANRAWDHFPGPVTPLPDPPMAPSE